METLETKASVELSVKTIVCKVSTTGKSMLVGHKFSKYDTGYTFGWCSNPDNLDKGDVVDGFKPKGRVAIEDENGDAVVHENGTAVMKWVFC